MNLLAILSTGPDVMRELVAVKLDQEWAAVVAFKTRDGASRFIESRKLDPGQFEIVELTLDEFERKKRSFEEWVPGASLLIDVLD
jgi:hypothetical protein